ncbi:hypothetical protein K435DRAFT_285337 [Dendrothele bispora CBS 962.96]|uniref:Uncharacterized protein n=1 Tax=Dendrothele bispora (strain CBS 962.96) TaxID=1314807 RepID=A0A4V4HHN6_DENBC|nr:hypothetical protein K435DRAFT_285337 [Dendrothele bispora CBS 962.96]
MPTEKKNKEQKTMYHNYMLLHLYVRIRISVLSSFPTRFKLAPLMCISLAQHSFPSLFYQSPLPPALSLLPHHPLLPFLLCNQHLHFKRSHISTPSTRNSLSIPLYPVHLPLQKRLSWKFESAPGTVTIYPSGPV